MKIKSINPISFEISLDTVTVVTDPLAFSEFNVKFPKTEGDVAVFTQDKYIGKEDILKDFDKLVGKNREQIFEIAVAGEFEIGQILIQRPVNAPFVILASGNSRIVLLGLDSKDADVNQFKDLGNVDVLIAPVGNGEKFIDYDKLQDVISEIEPSILVPYAFGSELGLKSKDEFLKHFGYTNFKDEKMLKVTAKFEEDERAMEVIFIS